MNTSQRIWNPSAMLVNIVKEDSNTITDFIRPESLLEQSILMNSQWQEGAFWGEPRPGHPEGKVIYHIHPITCGNSDSERHCVQIELSF